MSLFAGSACWFQSLLGVPCPGCGSTRAVTALARGDWGEAFRWHPLVPVLLAAAIPGAAFLFFRRRRTGSLRRVWNIAARAVLCAYVLVYAVRMVLWFPHTEPMVPLKTALWRLAWDALAGLFA